VADELRLLGCKVELYAEKEFVAFGAKGGVENQCPPPSFRCVRPVRSAKS